MPTFRAAALPLVAPLVLAALAVWIVRPLLADTNTTESATEYRDRIERESSELERVRGELKKARSGVKSMRSKEVEILGQLNTIDSDLSLKERLLVGLGRKEQRLAVDLEEIRNRLGGERAGLDERRMVLRRRLRNIYKFGEKPGIQVILGADSAVDLVRRFDWLLLVAAQDRLLYEEIQRSVEAVRATEAELAEKQDDVHSMRRLSEKEKAELVRRKDARAVLLSSVRTQKKRQQEVIAELQRAEEQVQSLIAQLEEKAREAMLESGLPHGTNFAGARGKLPWPVKGKVSRWFGVQKDKRFGTSTFNGGIDIQAEKETDVIAVHRGRADYVNWLPGYGQCIILNHGEGYYSLYAHTSTVFVSAGDRVEAGDVIATVGDTGSLMGDVLHFEIRKDAEPINPAPWLQPYKLH